MEQMLTREEFYRMLLGNIKRAEESGKSGYMYAILGGVRKISENVLQCLKDKGYASEIIDYGENIIYVWKFKETVKTMKNE